MQQRIVIILFALILAAGITAGNGPAAAPRSSFSYSAMRNQQASPGSQLAFNRPAQPLAPLDYGWEKAPQITSSKLNDLILVNALDGWAVGANGTILHWDGTTWQDFPSPTTKALNAIDMLNEMDGWAVGNGGEALHWNGTSWQIVPTGITGQNLWAVAMVSATQTWAAGDYGNIYRWDENAWTLLGNPTVHTLSDIVMISETDGWMAGVNGTLLHWDGSDWQNVDSPTSNALNGLSALSSSDVWVTASSGFLHWDGSQWLKVPTNFSGLEDVSMVSGKDGWAVGESGLLVHWDGSDWLQATSPVTYTLNAVDMLTEVNGWAVGFNGTLLQYVDQSPQLSINYSAGKPGSFFTLSGVRFPANSPAEVSVNGQTLGNVTADSQGELIFLLDTQNAGVGRYIVSANSSGVEPGVISFTLDPAADLHPQEGSGTIFQVPAGIAYERAVFVPVVSR